MFMGPVVWKKHVGETLYSLRCIPIGGFCAMEGEDEDTDNPRSFHKAAWWKRLIILVAGAGMNLLIGILIVAILYLPGQYVNVLQIDSFEDFSTLDDYGLMVGDEIIEIDGEKMYVYSDFSMMLSMNPGEIHDLVVLRDGKKVELNGFTMERHEVTLEDGTKTQMFGVTFSSEKLDFLGKCRLVGNTILGWIRSVRLSLQMLLSGQVGFSQVSGPVGIVNQMGQVAEQSATWVDALLNMLYFGAFIAVNLAVMNLLPIPALDGGRVVALLLTTAIEAIIRRKIDPKYEGYIHAAGMVLLLGLMAIIMFKDIFTIFQG